MNEIKQSWLYQQLAPIFGERNLSIHLSPTNEGNCFSVVRARRRIGWICLPSSLLTDEMVKLINVLVEQQGHTDQGTSGGAHLWQVMLHREMSQWRDLWRASGYTSYTRYGFVYLYIQDQEAVSHAETFALLSEIMQGGMGENDVFIPLHEHMYVWIIPNYAGHNPELQETLEALVETIISECSMSPTFFVGQPFTMPMELQALVEEERSLFQLALNFGASKSIVHFSDIIHFLLLNKCSQEELKKVAYTLLEPILEDHELLQTMTMFLRENLNASETAKKLYIHRNSMQYRLDKCLEKTGLDIRQFEDAAKAFLALKALGMLHKE